MTTKSKPPGDTVWAETMGSVLIPHSVMLPSTATWTNHETSPRSALCAMCLLVRSSTNFSHLPGGYFSDSIKLLTNHRYNTRTTAMAAASTTAHPAFPNRPSRSRRPGHHCGATLSHLEAHVQHPPKPRRACSAVLRLAPGRSGEAAAARGRRRKSRGQGVAVGGGRRGACCRCLGRTSIQHCRTAGNEQLTCLARITSSSSHL